MSDNTSTGKPTEEQLRAFLERQLSRLRPEIADLQTKFRDAVGRGDEDEAARLFRDALLLRLEYTQLLCEAERFSAQGNARWVSQEEPASFPPSPFAEGAPPVKRAMGFRPTEASAAE